MRRWLVTGVVAVVAGIGGVVGGWSLANDRLPVCEEDQALYPVGDFPGRGNVSVSDLGCVEF